MAKVVDKDVLKLIKVAEQKLENTPEVALQLQSNCNLRFLNQQYNFHVLSIVELMALHTMVTDSLDNLKTWIEYENSEYDAYMLDIDAIIKSKVSNKRDEYKSIITELNSLLSSDHLTAVKLQELMNRLL